MKERSRGANERVGRGRTVVTAVYSLYAVALTLAACVALWPIVVWLPLQVSTKLAAVRTVGAALQRATGITMTITGQLPEQGELVIVANHASFVDGLVLIMAIGSPAVFVVGSTFEHQRFLGRFLSGIGAVFVGGGSASEATSVTDSLTEIVRRGRRLAIFPEGHLSRSAEVSKFRLGAFRAATDAHVPVVPVGISGTRSIVTPGTRRAHRGRIDVKIGTPIAPIGDDWRARATLRDAAYEAILELTTGLTRFGADE